MIEITGATVLLWGSLLAIINYYLGLALGSLPLSKKIRSIGWMMVEDSTTYSILLVICATPPMILQIFSAIGLGNVDALYEQTFYPWLGISRGMPLQTGIFSIMLHGLIGILMTIFLLQLAVMLVSWAFSGLIYAFQVAAAGLLSSAALKPLLVMKAVVTGILGVYVSYRAMQYTPFIVLASATASTLYAIYYLAEFIRTYWTGMLGLGAILFGIPFRIGRRLGAVLIAASLVFYIGLPLMPYFIESTGKVMSAADALKGVQGDMEKAVGAVGVWQSPTSWPTTGEAFNPGYELGMFYETPDREIPLYEGDLPERAVGRSYNSTEGIFSFINDVFNIATGSDYKNASEINAGMDPPDFIQNIAVPEELAEFTFYAMILPTVYVWTLLITVTAGIARVMAGRQLL